MTDFAIKNEPLYATSTIIGITDIINERTSNVGITVDGVLIKDSIVSTDTINENSVNTGVTIDGVLLKDSIISTDTINEQSVNTGVTIEGVLLKDSIVSTDIINEKSTGVGVTIDGVLLKDNIVSTDTINEKSVNVGVTVEGVLLKDNIVSTDIINEKSTGVGVTIDGVLLKDIIISTDTINEKSVNTGVTVEGVLLKDSIINIDTVNVDTINEQSVNTGVTIEGVLLKDNIISTDTINENSTGVGVTVDGVLLKDETGTVNNIILGDGIDNGTMLNINTASTQLSTDNVNTNVNKWLKVYDTASASDMYIPMFSNPNIKFKLDSGYVPCSAWINFELTSGNDTSYTMINWETWYASANNHIVITPSLNEYFQIQYAGTYIVVATVNFDTSTDAGFVRLYFRQGTTVLADGRTNISDIYVTNYRFCTVTYIATLAASTNYNFYVDFAGGDGITKTYKANGGITRIA
jgi:hypothetical protein